LKKQRGPKKRIGSGRKKNNIGVGDESRVVSVNSQAKLDFNQSSGSCGFLNLRILIAFFYESSFEKTKKAVSCYLGEWSALFPWEVKGIFSSLEISTETGSAKRLTANEKIEFLCNEIKSGCPVMLLLGGCFHWISVWGYDSGARKFIIFDSNGGLKSFSHPVGNCLISYDELLDLWRSNPVFGKIFPKWLNCFYVKFS